MVVVPITSTFMYFLAVFSFGLSGDLQSMVTRAELEALMRDARPRYVSELLLALPYGVSLVEKHLTLDRALQLEDFVSAVDPGRFARFVERVRSAEAAVGRDDLSMTAAERGYRRKALKVVVACRDLKAGDVLARDGLRLIRTRLDDEREPVVDVDRAADRRLARGVKAGDPVYEDDLG